MSKSQLRSIVSHGLLPADFPAESDVRDGTDYDGGDLTGTLVNEGGDGVDVEIIVTEGVIE